MKPALPANQMTTVAGGTQLPWVPDARLHNLGVFGEAEWRFAQDQRLIGGLAVPPLSDRLDF